jgi:hypothetical protein
MDYNARRLHIILQALQETEQSLRRFVANLFCAGRLHELQCLFLHLQVGLDVDVRCSRTLVAEPERDQRDIDARLEKMDGCCVPTISAPA